MKIIIRKFTATQEELQHKATGFALVYLAEQGIIGQGYLRLFIDGSKSIEEAKKYTKFLAFKHKLGFFRVEKSDKGYQLFLSDVSGEARKTAIQEINALIATLTEEPAPAKAAVARKPRAKKA